MYHYGIIGNGQIAALAHRTGSLDWLCMPRPDSDPVFGRLLDPEGGHFQFEPQGFVQSSQAYVPNTNVLVTTVETTDGVYRITDFCPRFEQYGRIYRPVALFRLVEPVSGTPSMVVRLKPVAGWTKNALVPGRGNSHVRYELGADALRIATTMSLTLLLDEQPVFVREPIAFGLTWNYGIEEDLMRVTKDFHFQTVRYWENWVKRGNVPTLFQEQTIRSALMLKLGCYEDTGAILAALTTSLPEELGGVRNWDYRFCWLRDSAFVLSAFYRLGYFEEIEGFMKFLLDIVASSPEELKPVYRLDRCLPLPELEHANWQGFGNASPVRSGNQAGEHVQNDVYGEMIVTLAPLFFDERFRSLRSADLESMIGHLARACSKSIGTADAGLWELRSSWQEHSFTNLLCWAGLNRVRKIQERGFLKNIKLDIGAEEKRAFDALGRGVHDGSLRNGPRDRSFDASLLLLPIYGHPDKELSKRTVRGVQKALSLESSAYLYRYLKQDDFGKPSSAFLICSFWLIQALARIGERDEAEALLKETLRSSNHLHLFAEHYDPARGMQLGNFPQAYSHVGLINAAFDISPSWDQIM